MALTIYNTPYSYAPAYNQMIYTLSSTNLAQPNFRFIADVYANGSSNYIRLSCVANPNNNYGVFDISGILQNNLSRDSSEFTLSFNPCPNSIASYQVKFGEQYGPSSGITNYTNLTTSSGYCFNGSFDQLSMLYYDYHDYVLYDTETKFMTDTPKIITRVNEPLKIGYMNEFTFDTYLLRVKVYDSSNVLQNTVYIASTLNTQILQNRSVDVNISYDFLNSLLTGDLSYGTAPVFSANSNYYKISMVHEDEPMVFLQYSEERIIYIEDICSKYDPIRFKFMNNYGKYDYFTFTGAKTKNTDIKRNTFKQNPNQWSSTNYNYATTSRGVNQYETILNDTITIQSDWITEAESIWLEQLVTSPDVYIYDGSDLVAVNITNSNYQTKYVASEQLFNLSVTFQYSQNRKRQRR